MTTVSYVYAATRTPFGRFGGALAEVRPDDLASAALRPVLGRVPRWGVAAICIGVGQGLAVALENAG